MRKLVVSQFLTLDGIMEAPEKWNNQYMFDEEIMRDILEGFAASDSLLLGRTTYEFFAARWPARKGEMADWFNNVTKYVISTTLQKSEWKNSTVIGVEAIKDCKMLRGKNILVLGSYRLVDTLMNEQLIDEYKLYVYPLILGKGKCLFEEGCPRQTLELITTKIFSCGAIGITYKGFTNTSL